MVGVTTGGMAYPHSVPPVAQYCTPRRTAYHGTGAAEEQGSSSPRRRGNEVMGTTVPADPLVKRDTPRRAGKGSVVRRLLYNRQTYYPLLSIRSP